MRPLLAALAVVLALGAAAGTYFATRGVGSKIPKEQRIAILDEAKKRRIIHDYKVVGWNFHTGGGSAEYLADGEIDVTWSSGMEYHSLQIESSRATVAQAEALRDFARRRLPHTPIYYTPFSSLDEDLSWLKPTWG